MTNLAIIAPDTLPSLAAIEALTPQARLSAWLARMRPHTARAYSLDLSRFAAHLGAQGIGSALVALCELRHAVALTAVERYRDDMVAAGLASSTINRRLSAINSALAELAKADMGHGRLNVRPVPHEARRDTAGPATSKVARVIDELAGRVDFTSIRDLAVILLAAQRGLRRSEIAGLQLEHLRMDDGRILIRRKGKREMVAVEIAGATHEALALWLQARAYVAMLDETAVFVGTGNRWRGLAIGHNAIYAIIKKAGASIGSAWHPHDLRHTAITEALRLCHGSLAAAQEFAGHSAPQTTGRYIDDKKRLEHQAVDAMAGVFSIRK